MFPPSYKEQCWMFYVVKGHLDVAEETIKDCYDGYFKRIWYDEEVYYKEEGFEEAFEIHMEEKLRSDVDR